MNSQQANGFRTERDPIGEKKVPARALYGVQTQRALENFQISNLRIDHSLIIAIAEIKKAAAMAHLELGKVDGPIGEAIIKAADELIDGQHKEQFYNEERGFMGAAELAQKAIETGKSVEEVVEEE